MRAIVGAVITFCLAGCSELQVIGDAAMRELRADAVAVNWKTTERSQVGTELSQVVKDGRGEQVASVKVKKFSAFRMQKAKKAPVKGLWEQQGS